MEVTRRDGLRRRLARLAWHARVRMGRWAPPALALLLVLWTARAFLGPAPAPRPARPTAYHDAELWRQWRDRLRGADRDRWAGRTDSALRTYDRVARALSARPADRQRARYWHARLRLEAGERSAAIDLGALVRASDDPSLVARCALLALRFVDGIEARARVPHVDRVADDARAKLQSLSLREGPEGVRAQRWYDRMERARARLFSR